MDASFIRFCLGFRRKFFLVNNHLTCISVAYLDFLTVSNREVKKHENFILHPVQCIGLDTDAEITILLLQGGMCEIYKTCENRLDENRQKIKHKKTYKKR